MTWSSCRNDSMRVEVWISEVMDKDNSEESDCKNNGNECDYEGKENG